MHEFASTNKVIMAPGGSIHPTTDKSKVIKLLEYLVTNDTAPTSAQPTEFEERSETCLVVDGLRVVKELMVVNNFKTCKELGTSFVTLVDSKARRYC
ncbi:hypothetical protein LSH36_58g06026 [Paralvinella palmiformis]|uniref:Uncharacterized protein n=1 Tax=Paralvinella palmiformis TaxID=53620 RepID=A0AAD9K4S0_9ANNE|nr:hypothetical protein LSH36_58g06026 [Paralvinella palmiformis]